MKFSSATIVIVSFKVNGQILPEYCYMASTCMDSTFSTTQGIAVEQFYEKQEGQVALNRSPEFC